MLLFPGLGLLSDAGFGPSRRSCPFAYGGFRSKRTQVIRAAPASGGVALYLAAKRPLDRARKRSRPIRVTIAPPRISLKFREGFDLPRGIPVVRRHQN
jgi:hypothetical protein